MADNPKLAAEVRSEFGKGAARRIRAAHKIPAVLYGHGSDPRHLTLPGHELSLIVRKANALVELDIEGKNQLALVKDVQKDPVRQLIEHVDLIVIRRGEKVIVDVTVHAEGETAPGTIHSFDYTYLSLEVEATNIPENLKVSIEGAEAGTQIHARDVPLPEGAELITDPDALVINVTVPAAQVEEPTEDEEAAEAAGGETTDAAEEGAAAEAEAE